MVNTVIYLAYISIPIFSDITVLTRHTVTKLNEAKARKCGNILLTSNPNYKRYKKRIFYVFSQICILT